MTRLLRLATAFIIIALAAPAADAAAQLRLGIGAGPSFKASDLDEEGGGYGLGYHVQAMVGLRPAALPVGVQIDGAWNRFDAKDADGNASFFSGTANLVLGGAVSGIYVIGGAGVYSARVDDDHDHPAETLFGVNGGVGYRAQLTGLAISIDARLHNTLGGEFSRRFIPLTFGFHF